MTMPDLNLLVTLDVLLTEGSVAGAARRLKLSPSAMSRALARLRTATGDPLLVRAGRDLVLTPRALELREQAGRLVLDAGRMLRPAEDVDPASIVRMFALRVTDGFVENYGPALLERLERDAPGVRLRFVQKVNKDSAPLREGLIDLEIGVIGEETAPEIRTRALFRDRFVGAVRADHPLAAGDVTPARFAACRHVSVSRRGRERGAIDAALAPLGLERPVAVLVGSFATALALARASDLVASVPERHTARLRDGMHTFGLPVGTPPLTVSMLWHPRMEADPAHRWLRRWVYEVCAGAPAD
ncbi:LysR family transcriptional regulator [Massilia pinisoli]|uniref:LysR family transcriptional regulator n=1 Tax=Massilia pinisoli TaxID=1772194 RepID=A0ABT1ZJA5_9BURK|nr:LysR family transcriptional regulator [Massilia pinisoli]MCS0579991.1 LysR family transcriptional regulator [Massilia pinisoli]